MVDDIMWRAFALMVMLYASCLASGCSEEESAPTVVEKRAPLTKVPVEMLVKQRTTSAVPGSDGKLLLTVDDITKGQVMVTLATDGGTTILPTRSLKGKESAEFKFETIDYELTLRQLDNALVGEDSATFEISVPTEGGISETDKIERLISAVEDLKDARFIRNGSEYSATDAADHLRTKLKAAGDQIKSADDFIEHIGSKSSTSGEPYQIKFADGKTVNAGDFLREKLVEIE